MVVTFDLKPLPEPGERPPSVWAMVVAIASFWFISTVYTASKPYVVAAIDFAKANLTILYFELFFIIIAVSFAIWLYILKMKARRFYASIEILIGGGAAVYAANEIYFSSPNDSPAKSIFATVAGVYVIILGIDNWNTNRRERTYPRPP
jgi:hypothetical protein